MIVLPFILLSLLASAQTTLDQLIKEVSERPGPNVACEENTPEHCHHLSREACQLEKTKSQLREQMDYDLEDRHVHKLAGNPSVLQISRARQAAIREAERVTLQNAKVATTDLNKLVSEVKRDLINEINAGPIAAVVKSRMTTKINSIKFSNGAEYISGMKQWFIDNQGITAAEAESEATTFYAEICGNQGMEENAFYDPNIVAFVICPGMIQSLSEFGMDKPTFLNALSFTVAHEMGHAIDTALYPATYKTMGECHHSENFNWSEQSTEVVADYWGSKVLAQRMKDQQIVEAEALKTINFAQGYLCGIPGDEHHPDGDMRIDRIMGRDPQVRAQLGCPEPTKDSPFCGIMGRQSAR